MIGCVLSQLEPSWLSILGSFFTVKNVEVFRLYFIPGNYLCCQNLFHVCMGDRSDVGLMLDQRRRHWYSNEPERAN